MKYYKINFQYRPRENLDLDDKKKEKPVASLLNNLKQF